MITLSAGAAFGKTGQYIARIEGRHSEYTFDRAFVGRKTGTRHETTEADIDEPGLYEICDVTKRGKIQRYIFVLDVGHRIAPFDCTKPEAMRVARAMSEGGKFTKFVRANAEGSGYQVLTTAAVKREERKADVARSRDRVVNECWAILEALPTRDAKRVVTELRKRLKPSPGSPDPSIEVPTEPTGFHEPTVAPDAAPDCEPTETSES